jgi:hypothetical protein
MASITPCAEEMKPFLFAYYAPTAFQIYFCLTINGKTQISQSATSKQQGAGRIGKDRKGLLQASPFKLTI